MPLPQSTVEALTAAGIAVQQDLPLSELTYWRIGGPADGLADVASLDALRAVQRIATREGIPVFVLGKGSNLLVADAGIRGLVVRLVDRLADVTVIGGAPPRIEVGAGMPLVKLLARARQMRWSGLSCFAGIPGTVGGAVRMNAGSALGETMTPLVAATVVTTDGDVRTLPVTALRMSYRTSHLPPGAIVATATLQTTDEDFDPQHARMVAFLKRRKATQPLSLPSCGSTFKNPDGDHAGRLIEAAGLKGYRIGGAAISDKHANFIVNEGGATAADVRRVIEHAQRVVADRFGVDLVREVHFVGDWAGWKADTT